MLKLFSLLGALALLLVAVLDLSSATAQNDEQTGRIVARLLDDGRVEFGWQPTGGARVLPRQRYFPADITHNRWLRSSPVEVGGAAIGRINARLRPDGRIEFAFTPTDRERILTDARYFPAGARVGRWLRSTEIAIGPSASGFRTVSAGHGFTCAIRTSGAIACWGWNEYGLTDAPDGAFRAVSAGFFHACGLRENGKIECWGKSEGDNQYHGESDAPEGSFTAVSAGNSFTCGIRESGEIECWGVYSYAPPGSFTAVSAGFSQACAIREGNGAIECWGDNEHWAEVQEGRSHKPEQTDPPEGRFTAVSRGSWHACGLRDTGEIECWGANETYTGFNQETREAVHTYTGQATPPEGNFVTVSAGGRHTCGLRTGGEIECWGANGVFVYPRSGPAERTITETGVTNEAPSGRFVAVSAGSSHNCAIRNTGAIECWGSNLWGQASPPTD